MPFQFVFVAFDAHLEEVEDLQLFFITALLHYAVTGNEGEVYAGAQKGCAQ